jgi:hypothetical protein
MFKALCLVLLLLTGCTGQHNIVETEFYLTVTLVDQPVNNGKEVRAYAVWDEGKCDIVLTKDAYPMNLEHEVRHCIEHYWHGKD